jgi:predicted metal-dependent phosphoesterase TrpH
MRADLHLHSTASDGELTPSELVARGAAGGLTVLALTDHDSTAGIAEAQSVARDLGVVVVPGVELSATRDGREIHVLGYGFDPAHPTILRRGERARSLRRDRMALMVERLRHAGVEVSLEEVEVTAGSARTMLGRPHLARTLVRFGRVASVDEAFDRWIGDRQAAFVPTDLGSPQEAIETILDAGGIPVWAHPPGDILWDWLPEFAEMGLQGVEALRAGWSPGKRRRVAKAGRQHGLCITGGSDWHGPTRSGRLGDFWLDEEQVRDFLERLRGLPGVVPPSH